MIPDATTLAIITPFLFEICLQGKGYPDLATRQFLFRLAHVFPRLLMLCLVDADPYGVDIFLTYKFGSRTAAAEPDCTVASLVWIGVDLAFLRDQNIDEAYLLDMNERDVQKAKSLAERDCLKNQEPELRYSALLLSSPSRIRSLSRCTLAMTLQTVQCWKK